MSIYSAISSFYPGYGKTSMAKRASEKQDAFSQSVSGKRRSKKRDSIEISLEAYEMQTKDGQMHASSGKDALGISKGAGEGSYVIHFSDSAMVSRTIARGYVTVNGIEISLSDEVKKQLAAVDKRAQADRETAYNQYIMEHEIAVAQQQGKARTKANKDMAEAIKIAARIMKGEKVSSAEMKKLMEVSPQLYAMAMELKNMADEQEKHKSKGVVAKEQQEEGNAAEGVSWSDFEWKSFETQMTVSTKGNPSVGSITEGVVSLN